MLNSLSHILVIWVFHSFSRRKVIAFLSTFIHTFSQRAIQERGVKVAVNPHLEHPLILGTSWPAFSHLLGYLCVYVSWKKEKQAVQVEKGWNETGRICAYHPQTDGLVEKCNRLWKRWFESSFTKGKKLRQMVGTPFVHCTRGPTSLHRVFPLWAPLRTLAPWGMGHPKRDLGGGNFRYQKRNSACAGPENKTPLLGAALDGEFVTGPRQAEPAVQSGNQITRFCTGR